MIVRAYLFDNGWDKIQIYSEIIDTIKRDILKLQTFRSLIFVTRPRNKQIVLFCFVFSRALEMQEN